MSRNKNKPSAPMEAALSYLDKKARTEAEMTDHLYSLNYGDFEVYTVVERLKELELLNDAAYAREFVESRLRTKPISKAALFRQLKAHSINTEAIEQALSQLPEDTERDSARECVQKYLRIYGEYDEKEREARVLKRLISRGYSYELAKECLKDVINGENEL